MTTILSSKEISLAYLGVLIFLSLNRKTVDKCNCSK